MRKQNKMLKRMAAVLAVSTLYLSACAEIRTLTYPENFTWIGKSEVSSVMNRFSNSLFQIDIAATRKQPGDVDIVITELSKMIDEASSLMSARQANGNNAIVTNHLLIDEHLDDFLNDLNRAKLLIEEDSSNLYVTGNLTGSCTACHQYQ